MRSTNDDDVLELLLLDHAHCRFVDILLQENVRERGAAWSEKVDIALKALNDGLVAQEESSDPWAAAQPDPPEEDAARR